MVNIVINRSDSRCEGCGKSASMYEEGHYIILGYVDNGQPGCGMKWTGVTSDYIMMAEQLAESDEGYFFAENLRGLPVYSFFSDGQIGVYGGPTGKNEALPEVRQEEDSSVPEAEDLL